MYVADAHALGWYFTDDSRLGQEAAHLFNRSERGECTVLIPTIVLGELFRYLAPSPLSSPIEGEEVRRGFSILVPA